MGGGVGVDLLIGKLVLRAVLRSVGLLIGKLVPRVVLGGVDLLIGKLVLRVVLRGVDLLGGLMPDGCRGSSGCGSGEGPMRK